MVRGIPQTIGSDAITYPILCPKCKTAKAVGHEKQVIKADSQAVPNGGLIEKIEKLIVSLKENEKKAIAAHKKYYSETNGITSKHLGESYALTYCIDALEKIINDSRLAL